MANRYTKSKYFKWSDPGIGERPEFFYGLPEAYIVVKNNDDKEEVDVEWNGIDVPYGCVEQYLSDIFQNEVPDGISFNEWITSSADLVYSFLDTYSNMEYNKMASYAM